MEEEFHIETDKVQTIITIKKLENTFMVSSQQERPVVGSRMSIRSVHKGTPEEYASKGGTSLYCPSCRKVTRCEVTDPSMLSGKSGRRWYKVAHSDIQWFRRARKCRTCFYYFNTAEVQEEFINELVELREDILRGKKVSIKDLASYGENIIPFPEE